MPWLGWVMQTRDELCGKCQNMINVTLAHRAHDLGVLMGQLAARTRGEENQGGLVLLGARRNHDEVSNINWGQTFALLVNGCAGVTASSLT